MKKKFSVDQIVGVLKEAEGMPVAELIRKVGVSKQTFFRGQSSVLAWRSMSPSDGGSSARTLSGERAAGWWVAAN
jgi:ACT domain-containing protein